MFTRKFNQSGFTLIELVIIIVVLGILAAVAIPKYQDISSDAKEAACRSALGGLRSGITIFYANTAVQTGTATWPALSELRGTDVMARGIPMNPYASISDSADDIFDGSALTKGDSITSNAGWVYKASTGELWPATFVDNENQW
ncbi:MAG: prepilin-type N-terminal cleavage/methylation domain-containing protein [candidate division Zixibacteria bacterium]|nr:prepilin-type N-terminal cleavage/methylation domain-containing protein [candidate division Zixibacteria bacterium]